jgi:hypothetical protein
MSNDEGSLHACLSVRDHLRHRVCDDSHPDDCIGDGCRRVANANADDLILGIHRLVHLGVEIFPCADIRPLHQSIGDANP